MHTKQHRRGLTAALGLCALSAVGLMPTPARAEIDLEVFAGGKFFSTDGRLSRQNERIRLDSNSAMAHSGILGVRLGWLPIPRLGLELEVGATPTRTRGEVLGSQPSIGVLPVRANVLFNILTGRFRPFVLVGGGTQVGSPSGTSFLQVDAVGAFHAGVGAKFDIRENWGVRLDGRFIMSQGIDKVLTPEGEVLLSFYGRFLTKKQAPEVPKVVDGDGDGVPDKDDMCPGVAGLAQNSGCPDQDGDNDGVVDRLDKCPAAGGPAENGGCPDQDGDNDGVVDRLDKCPGVTGDKDNGGCPPRDADGDGVPDKLDRCPAESGVADNGGCPDKDGDNDGVVDRLDKCPNEAETKNNYQDEDGCPDELPKAVQQFTGAIQGINFQAGQAVITQGSFKVLDKAVQVLKENPSVKLEISGHTDNTGDAQKNRELSQARAEAVRKYMVDKGVGGERLKAVGYGPDKPLADNKTPAGRTKNRRVEFALIK